MKEITPGLFIGNIHSLYEIPKINKVNDSKKEKEREQHEHCYIAKCTQVNEKGNQQQQQPDEPSPSVLIKSSLQQESLSEITTWTIISILHSHKLRNYSRRIIEEMIRNIPTKGCTKDDKDHDKNARMNENLDLIHIEWELKDHCTSTFLLSPDLIRILHAIDVGVMGRSTTHVTNHNALQTKQYCLVHCAMGQSRSVSVCIAWLLSRKYCSTLMEAFDIIQKGVLTPQHEQEQHEKDEQLLLQPNLGFLADLRAIEQCQGNLEAAIQRKQKYQQQLNPKTTM